MLLREKCSMPSLCDAVWRMAEVDEALALSISREHGVSLPLARCLVRLGLEAGEEVGAFLSPGMSDLHDPYLMHGMREAVSRFRQAIEGRESVRVVTDYDVDGTMSSLILQSVLRLCGHTLLSYHIPDRRQEGYGFTLWAARRAVEDGVRLIVTADIGVRDEEAIDFAQSHGVDVIVLDHHLPQGAGVPARAHSVLCPPQKACGYPNKSLAACGIALKFAQAMLSAHAKCEAMLLSMMKLAALGTIADVVSLREQENRAIVSMGLRALNEGGHKPGLEALLRVSKVRSGSIEVDDVGYRIAPRINAAGRMATATHVIELMHAANSVEAQGMASCLDAMNTARQEVQGLMVERAMEEVSRSTSPFLVVALEESAVWHSGISGVVAGRIRENCHCPVAVATISGETVTGSIRSTPGVHAVKALTSISEHLTKFGGHAAAAGFTCDRCKLDLVRAGLEASVLEQLGQAREVASFDVAMALRPLEVSRELLEDLMLLEPCGMQNKRPLVCLEGVRFGSSTWMKGEHWKGTLPVNGFSLEVVWFGAPGELSALLQGEVDVLGEFQRHHYGGQVRYQLRVIDMR
ncbi:MAG: single-stranded-DNA-specific exonuclease RecJ [Proteobacteria bacterium]|nr:single-stranded-DNA-specific exonuclease RecJ [Pseudomonadota bacterium]